MLGVPIFVFIPFLYWRVGTPIKCLGSLVLDIILLLPTFLKEEAGAFFMLIKSVDKEISTYLGEGYHANGAEFLSGGYPVEGDRGGVAISDTLAFSLYGSKNVVGLDLTYEEQLISICVLYFLMKEPKKNVEEPY